MIKFLKYIFKFFVSIDIYHSNKKKNYILPRYYKFYVIKSFSNIKSKKLKGYFYKFRKKKERFKKGQYFLALCYKKKLVSSGWMSLEKSWLITEIDRKVKLLNQRIIFDFITPEKERRKGYYTKLLKIVRNKFGSKEIFIYALSSNRFSKAAIISAGFKHNKRLYKINFN